MKISKATLKDCKEMYELSFVSGLANPEGNPPPQCWTEAFVKEKKYAHVIKDGKKVVAYLLAERTCGGVGLVWMLGVDKRYRNKGLGTSLLKHVAKQMKEDGLHVVIAYGYARNPAVKHILKKLKFNPGCNYVEYVKFLGN
jgi:ribosomal protein S18 acetylase RimI-like enzyme